MAPVPTTTRAALHRAALAKGADDTNWLVLIDCMEEEGVLSSLDAMKWRMAYDPSDWRRLVFASQIERDDPEWAEWIRVGCELLKTSRWEYYECKVCGATPDDDGEIIHGKGCYVLSEDGGGSEWAEDNPQWQQLTARDTALRAILEPCLRRGAKCERCGGRSDWHDALTGDGRCLDCHGTGWSGALARSVPTAGSFVWERRVDWQRGFPSTVHVDRPADVFNGEKPTPWAIRLIREWPMIEQVVMSQAENWIHRWAVVVDGKRFGLREHSRNRTAEGASLFIPPWLLEEVKQDGQENRYVSEAAALDALATAVPRVLRRAGMEAIGSSGSDSNA